MIRGIDELSNLTTKKAEEPEEYFKKMDLNKEQVQKRLDYTKKANDLFDVILILLLTMDERGETNFYYARNMLETWLLSLIAEYTTPDDYLIDYATDTAYNFVDTTVRHFDDPWYTSSDRALYNAENGANDVLNYSEYQEAIEAGKTHKRWITENDNKVRETHRELHRKELPIREFFQVGVAQMRFPKDYEKASMFPEELVNCRCTIQYLPEDGKLSNELSQRKKGQKVTITDHAINQVGLVGPSDSTEEELKSMQEMNREILRTSMNSNNSNEVAMALYDNKMSKPVLGDNKTVNIYADTDMYHLLKDIDTPERSVTLSHNHPGLSYFSMDDLGIFVENPTIKTMQVVTNLGKVWSITKKGNYDDIKAMMAYNTVVKNKNSKNMVAELMKSIYNMVERN